MLKEGLCGDDGAAQEAASEADPAPRAGQDGNRATLRLLVAETNSTSSHRQGPGACFRRSHSMCLHTGAPAGCNIHREAGKNSSTFLQVDCLPGPLSDPTPGCGP